MSEIITENHLKDDKRYIGRFAPSPTGYLHIGSLLAAVGSFLDAKKHHGLWLVRMEDLDPPREKSGARTHILKTLEAFGLYWDKDVVYQSQRSDRYQNVLNQLIANNSVYPCACSRRDIKTEARHFGVDAFVYGGRCCVSPPKVEHGVALRVKTDDRWVGFDDAIVGCYGQNLAQDVGDFVLKRKDGLWAYQLAVVVDDYLQGINHIVRGQDLLVSTPRQIYLQSLLGFDVPKYAHLPLLVNSEGQKWSKQTCAPALDTKHKEAELRRVLSYLNVAPSIPEDLNCIELLQWAQEYWDIHKVRPDAIVTGSNPYA